jgi:hypothetical protein
MPHEVEIVIAQDVCERTYRYMLAQATTAEWMAANQAMYR